MSDKSIHLCLYKGRYQILSRGRVWLKARRIDGPKSYCDQILINPVSIGWNVGDTVDFIGLHHDTITSFGHDVRLVPSFSSHLDLDLIVRSVQDSPRNFQHISNVICLSEVGT